MKLLNILFLSLCISSAFASDNLYKAARKHVELIQNISSTDEMAESMVNGIFMSKPQLRPFKYEFTSFFKKILSSEEYKEGQTRIYMDIFTLEELEYANKAFSDPRLASYMKKAPLVLEKSMIFGGELGSKHGKELDMAIEAKALELEALSNERSNK